MNEITLDETDRRLLDLLQTDASRSNQALAEVAGISPPTCLRRVRRLVESGVIARQVALLDSDTLAPLVGHGLTALVELTLDAQDAERLARFEARACADAAVQQCYRVSPGPDFMLVVRVRDMPGYQALAQRLFHADWHVRSVKAFFSIHCAKFEPKVPLAGD
ncbi:Lrp/AsnC family transcriptional regulator [Sphingomonas sp. NCPPB 2930]